MRPPQILPQFSPICHTHQVELVEAQTFSVLKPEDLNRPLNQVEGSIHLSSLSGRARRGPTSFADIRARQSFKYFQTEPAEVQSLVLPLQPQKN